ncbi:MAG TPA: carbohydrate ABC transporter permease [Thermomicrobiales bacterium]|nr:carbohydrate ABC transporter permease [Thermomicrobiales bacterium]
MHSKRFNPGMVVVYLLLLAGVAVTITPLLWTLSTSLKTVRQLSAWPPEWIPNPVAWSNYSEALTMLPFERYFLNTMVLVVAAEIGALITCSFVAYGFARLDFPGREPLFLLLISTMLMPYIVRLVPLFVFYGEIGWLGTYLPLAVPDLLGRNAFYIFLLRQFFRGIPDDLSDAARIDGANDFRIWWSVVLPLSKPVLATVAIFAFQSTWDDFLGPLIYMGQNPDMRTLAVGLYQFRNSPGGENLMPYLMAVSTVMMLPILFIFGFGQRYLVQGVTMSGLKG